MRVLAWPIESSLNPYTSLLYSNLGPCASIDKFSLANLLKHYSVWHMHWPDALLNIPNTPHAVYKVAGLFAAMDYLRSRGTKVVWTMHNFGSHEALHPTLEKWFWRQFIPRVDGAISLSATGLSIAKTQFPRIGDIPTAVIPHGHYRDAYPQAIVGARESLGIPKAANVLLFFGAVRPYKNVDVLVRGFRDVKRAGALLYIVGRPNYPELAERILKEAALDSRVRVIFEFVKQEDVSTYLNASDLVVLPYREVLNSGSALLALSCNRPILVPDLGAMGELRTEFGDQWVRTFAGQLDEMVLERAVEWATQTRPSICPMPDRYNWGNIGLETVKFYQRVVSAKVRSKSFAIRRDVSVS